LWGGIAERTQLEALDRRLNGPNGGTSREPPSDERFPHLLTFLHGLYPGRTYADAPKSYLAALEPDLLGERLVEEVLGEDGGAQYLIDVCDAADPRALRQGFVVLGRIATRTGSPEAEDWLRRALDVDVPGRARAVFDAALSLGLETAHGSIGLVLYEALKRDGTPELAGELEPLLPDDTVSLREVAAWATTRRLESLPLAAESGPEDLNERARLLNNLGARLSRLGRREEALDVTLEAVRIHRILAQQRPEAFRAYLAGSLNNLGIALSELGRREHALNATEEAVQHYRALVQQHHDAFLPELATSLTNLRAPIVD